MRRSLRCAAVMIVFIVGGCGDDVTAPAVPGGDPPARLVVAIPDTIVQGRPFTLTVTALTDAGAQDRDWSGEVSLSASSGSLAPASVQLANGSASVQATLSGYAGDVTIGAATAAVQATPVSALVLSAQPPSRMEIVPAAALLTGAGTAQPFEVRAFDAQGALTVLPQVTWQSNDEAVLTIDGNGTATAQAALGSAQIVASADGVDSAPATVLVAQPVAGALLLADSQIVSDVVPVDAAAPYEPGWQYTIRVHGVSPDIGTLLLGAGGRPLAGRVVSSTAVGTQVELTIELVPLNQLFEQLRIDERIPLIEMETAGSPGPFDAARAASGVDASTDFKLGGFNCKAAVKPALELPKPKLELKNTLALDLVYNNGIERMVVDGDVSADFGYKPVFKSSFSGEVTCDSPPRTFTIPIGGVISWFFGIQVPIGVGMKLDGSVDVAEVGFDFKANATASTTLGFTCVPGGGCSGVREFETGRDGSFEFIAPDPDDQFRVKLGGYAYLYAKPSIGSSFTKAAQFEFISADAGLKQSFDLATAHGQVNDTNYASEFHLSLLANVGAGSGITDALKALSKLTGVELKLDMTLLAHDDTLARSPRGTFVITPERVAPGDTTELGEMAKFTIELDPVEYLGAYAIDRVELFWKNVDENNEFTLDPPRPLCAAIVISAGQTKFECETDFLEEHGGEQTFYAFVYPRLFGVPLPVPLEIAADAFAVVDVDDCQSVAYLNITTQTEVNDAAGICEAVGLYIEEAAGTADPIVDLTPLSSLKRVTNQVEIENTTRLADLTGLGQLRVAAPQNNSTGSPDFLVRNNSGLTSLNGLPATPDSNAAWIANVSISSNPVLADISALSGLMRPHGMEVGWLTISDMPLLRSLTGVESITRVHTSLTTSQTGITSLSPLAGITRVDGRVAIEHNPGLTTLDLTMDALLGDLEISGNDALISATISIGDVGTDAPNGFRIIGNDALQSLSISVGAGVPGFNLFDMPALTDLQLNVTGGRARYLNVSTTGLASMGSSNITRLEHSNGLSISKNPSLTDIDALGSISYVLGRITIINNVQLCIPEWVRDIDTDGGFMISGNECN